ncbi:hypothetical protein Tco_0773675, partial [Tanacetum coccineum]
MKKDEHEWKGKVLTIVMRFERIVEVYLVVSSEYESPILWNKKKNERNNDRSEELDNYHDGLRLAYDEHSSAKFYVALLGILGIIRRTITQRRYG